MGIRHRVRMAALFAGLALLVGCAESTWAPEAEVSRALYSPVGLPATITLFTVQSTRSGNGAHSGLMVNGAHRAMFDPAGTFYHPAAPERNDVHFGITDNIVKVYIDYHARETFDVVVQEVEVSQAVADRALAAMQAYGAVPNAQCTLAVSRVLASLPGFEAIDTVWFPNRLSEDFARLPGATYRRITDDDADANHGVLLEARNVHEDVVRAMSE